MDDVLLESKDIHRRADAFLKSLGILEAWERLGAEVRFVGHTAVI